MQQENNATTQHKTLQEIADSWISRVLDLSPTSESYPDFGPTMVSIMRDIRRELQQYETRDDIHTLRRLADVIQDGLARLFASWREQLEYEDFSRELDSEKKIWSDSLTI